MRVDLDCAFLDHSPIIGLKLDKAKAFDRIVPEYAAALFLAFGLPKTLVNFFLKMYKGLRRHLSYRNWRSPHATTPANGVAQGCSLSLLAMNAYNKVWFHLLEYLPEITARAFIDDAYLWCHLQHVSVMAKAIEVAQLWDKLVGQKLNPSKSSMWGSNCEARKSFAKRSLIFRSTLNLWFLALGCIALSVTTLAFALPRPGKTLPISTISLHCRSHKKLGFTS